MKRNLLKRPSFLILLRLGAGFAFLSLLLGCASAYKESLGKDTTQTFSRIYLTDFDTAWYAALESLKRNRLDVSNREGGILLTKWTDNTAEKNLVDSFGGADAYHKAQFRLKLTLAKGFYDGKPSVRVTVIREQLIQRDVLEGWKPIVSDSIEENTMLYRIGRLIWIKMKLAKLEEQKSDAAAKETLAPENSSPPSDTSPSDTSPSDSTDAPLDENIDLD